MRVQAPATATALGMRVTHAPVISAVIDGCAIDTTRYRLRTREWALRYWAPSDAGALLRGIRQKIRPKMLDYSEKRRVGLLIQEPDDPIPPCLDCGGQDGTCCHEPDEFCCLSDDNVNFVCCPDSACSCVKPLPPGGITCADGRADCGRGVCCDAAQFCCEVDREGQLLQFCVERGGLCQ